jgi:pimeloyl-ACP methyl ester carboxylesterase
MNNNKPELKTIKIANAGTEPQTEIQYLHYNGDGPVLILLHATGFLPWLWHPIASALAGRYEIIAPYFCDHRCSEPEDGGLDWGLLANDLCGFCKTLEIKKPLLAGHSMGATVITIANAVYGSPAEKMILIEPIFLPEPIYTAGLTVEQHPLASKSIKRKNSWESKNEIREYLIGRPLFKSWDSGMLDLYIEYGFTPGENGGFTLACQPRKEASLFMGGSAVNPWPLLKQITTPALILEGELSENRAFIDLKKAASVMQSASYRLIEGAGHLIPMEQPEKILRIFSEFFG